MVKIIIYKLFTLCICIINVFNYNTSASDLCKPVYSDEALNIAENSLMNIGISLKNDEFNKYITRAEVATWLDEINAIIYKINLQDLNEELVYEQIYTDVPVDYWAHQSICRARYILHYDVFNDVGLMMGDGNGYFRPDEYITYQEFAKVLVSMTGWGYYTERFTDGYPTGYYDTANKLGIYLPEKENMVYAISREDAIMMLYSALKAPIITFYMATGVLFKYSGETLFTSFSLQHSIYETRGYAKKLDDGRVLIEDATYYGQVDTENFDEGLVFCFYEEVNGRRNILSCYPISSLDFDNLNPISNELPKSFWVIGEEVFEYEPGLEVEGR